MDYTHATREGYRRVGPWANSRGRLLRPSLRQTHEIRDGAYPKLVQHPAAVDLDGLFDRAKIAGNLLVEPPSDDMRKDFAFARGQGGKLRLN